MNNIFFSIIIPCYNSSEYITDTINSILRQTYSNYELILIDDGSTDDTLDVIYKSVSGISNVIVLKSNHNGVAFARRTGILKSSGDYLLFLDSDDMFVENSLFVLNKYIQMSKCDVLSFKIATFSSDNTPCKPLPITNKPFSIEGNESLISFLYLSEPRCANLPTACYKRSLFTKFAPVLTTWCEDVFEAYYAFKNAKNFYDVPDCLYRYRIHKESVTHSLTSNHYFSKSCVFTMLYSDLFDSYSALLLHEKGYVDGVSHEVFSYFRHCQKDIMPLYINRVRYLKSHVFFREIVLNHRFKSIKLNILRHLVKYNLFHISKLLTHFLK